MSDTETEKDKKLPLFRDINADDPEPETSNIESVCMNCFKNVSYSLSLLIILALKPTKIYFKNLILNFSLFLGYNTITFDKNSIL